MSKWVMNNPMPKTLCICSLKRRGKKICRLWGAFRSPWLKGASLLRQKRDFFSFSMIKGNEMLSCVQQQLVSTRKSSLFSIWLAQILWSISWFLSPKTAKSHPRIDYNKKWNKIIKTPSNIFHLIRWGDMKNDFLNWNILGLITHFIWWERNFYLIFVPSVHSGQKCPKNIQKMSKKCPKITIKCPKMSKKYQKMSKKNVKKCPKSPWNVQKMSKKYPENSQKISRNLKKMSKM